MVQMDWCHFYTGGHSFRVAEISRRLLGVLSISSSEAALIVWAARWHDIGKMGLPNHILGKPGYLNATEQRVLALHPERGASWLLRYRGSAQGAAIVRHHHERWDGAGYPDGLKGRDIPTGARLIAVADSFDALTSDRPYRSGASTAEALHVLRAGRGQQWDPSMVDALLQVMEPGALSGAGRGPEHIGPALGSGRTVARLSPVSTAWPWPPVSGV
jgi:HD-GYP domain-containing protein (c-di-GMP phosphodiesterase class II)